MVLSLLLLLLLTSLGESASYLDLDLAHITYRYSCGRGSGLPDGSGGEEERRGQTDARARESRRRRRRGGGGTCCCRRCCLGRAQNNGVFVRSFLPSSNRTTKSFLRMTMTTTRQSRRQNARSALNNYFHFPSSLIRVQLFSLCAIPRDARERDYTFCSITSMITRARDNKAIWPCERVSLGDGDAVGGKSGAAAMRCAAILMGEKPSKMRTRTTTKTTTTTTTTTRETREISSAVQI